MIYLQLYIHIFNIMYIQLYSINFDLLYYIEYLLYKFELIYYTETHTILYYHFRYENVKFL